MTAIHIKKKNKFDLYMERIPCEDEGREHSDGSRSQGAQKVARGE